MIRAGGDRIKPNESGISGPAELMDDHHRHPRSFIVLKVQIPRHGSKMKEGSERWKCAAPHCQKQPVNSDQQGAVLNSVEDKLNLLANLNLKLAGDIQLPNSLETRQGTEIKAVDAASAAAPTRTSACHPSLAGAEERGSKAAN